MNEPWWDLGEVKRAEALVGRLNKDALVQPQRQCDRHPLGFLRLFVDNFRPAFKPVK